jgi:hypothetical protein
LFVRAKDLFVAAIVAGAAIIAAHERAIEDRGAANCSGTLPKMFRHRAPESRKSGQQTRRFALALSRITEIGEQAVAAIAASLARGGPVVKGQLIASRFYEAMQRELKQLPMHDPKRAALIAASDRCERIAAASINPTALLDELRKAIAVLEADTHPPVSLPTKARPVLRLIVGGLSRA